MTIQRIDKLSIKTDIIDPIIIEQIVSEINAGIDAANEKLNDRGAIHCLNDVFIQFDR